MAAEDVLIEQAVERTCLTDFGETDFRIGLRVLVAALDESALSAPVAATLRAGWVDTLATRLQLVDVRRRTPDVAAQRIESPVVVIGLPRTGTTALVDLLAQDPKARAPLQWETASLIPPADPAHWDDDPRIAAVQAGFDADAADPSSYAALGLHTHGATLPDECNHFLSLDFWSPNFIAPTPLPRYGEWLALSSPRRPYRFHRWVLQHLQAHGPTGRWTLKSPFHGFALGALLEEYPDATLVQTHRDPLELMPSVAGLFSTIRREPPKSEARVATGHELIGFWSTGLRRCLAERADPAIDARIFDVSHRRMASDPLGTLVSVYEHFCLPITADYERRAKEWIEAPSQGRSSVSFHLTDFGLAASDVEAAFGPYRSRFGEYF